MTGEEALVTWCLLSLNNSTGCLLPKLDQYENKLQYISPVLSSHWVPSLSSIVRSPVFFFWAGSVHQFPSIWTRNVSDCTPQALEVFWLQIFYLFVDHSYSNSDLLVPSPRLFYHEDYFAVRPVHKESWNTRKRHYERQLHRSFVVLFQVRRDAEIQRDFVFASLLEILLNPQFAC